MAVSNTTETKLYRIASSTTATSNRLSPKRLRLPGVCSPPAHALAFTSDGSRLIIAAEEGDIRVVDLGLVPSRDEKVGASGDRGSDTHSEPRLVHCFEEHVDGVGPGGGDGGAVPISALTLSASGKWLVSTSVSGVVYVFNLASLQHHWTAPRYGMWHFMAWYLAFYGMVCRATYDTD